MGAVVSVCTATALVVWHDALSRLVGVEAYRTLLQFLLVVVLGGGVSLVYQAYNRDSDRRVERFRQMEARAAAVQEARQRHLRALIDEYHSVKRVRRLLRATALNHEEVFADRRVRVSRYDDLMQIVLDSQLTLETMARTMRTDGGAFATDLGLIEAVSAGEEYLRALITEYEEVMPKTSEPDIALRLLPELAAFLGPYRDAERFRVEFVHSMNAALASVERAIVNPGPAG